MGARTNRKERHAYVRRPIRVIGCAVFGNSLRRDYSPETVAQTFLDLEMQVPYRRASIRVRPQVSRQEWIVPEHVSVRSPLNPGYTG